MLNVRDVVSPHAYTFLRVFGYMVFAAAISFVIIAGMRATLDFADEVRRFRAWRRVQTYRFVPPKARVLAFPAKRTRNRMVVR